MLKPFAPKVFQLGYVAMGVTDFERSKAHFAETIGMSETDVGHDGESYLSVGYEHHNVVLHKASEASFAHVGYQLNHDIDLNDFLRDAEAFGVKGKIKSDSQPGIKTLVEIEAAQGNIIQFYNEISAPAPGFKKTGVAPLRLGHWAVISSEGEKLMKFHTDFLGFRATDTIGEGLANFFTCNRDHHVVNIVSAPVDRIHHIAFELKGNASHAMASDQLREDGVPVLWGPARHTAGHNLAGYHHAPDGVLIELYTDMDIYLPELDMCEARPWHEHYPMKPKDWGLDQLCAWETQFSYQL